MTSLSKQRIVAGGLAVAYLWWAWRRIKKSKGANGIGGWDNDLLPTSLEYSRFLDIAQNKFGISREQARKKYGLYTIGQWNKLLGIGKVDFSDFDGARIVAKDGLHGIEFNIYGGGGVVVSSVYKGKGKYGSIWEYLSHIGEYKTLSGAVKAAKKYWDARGIKYDPKDFEKL